LRSLRFAVFHLPPRTTVRGNRSRLSESTMEGLLDKPLNPNKLLKEQ
jgi:hypothetical protein